MKPYLIQSSNILSIDYDEMTSILEIEFKHRLIHHYFEVPLDEFVAFMKATDKEEFYHNFIKCKYHFETFKK